MFLIIFLMLVGFAVLAFYKRPINTQLGWAPPPHVLFGHPPAGPQPPSAAPQADATTTAAPSGSGPVQRLATFAPPPPAPGAAPSTFAPPPAPGSIKLDQPPPVDLNDLFNRPNA